MSKITTVITNNYNYEFSFYTFFFWKLCSLLLPTENRPLIQLRTQQNSDWRNRKLKPKQPPSSHWAGWRGKLNSLLDVDNQCAWGNWNNVRTKKPNPNKMKTFRLAFPYFHFKVAKLFGQDFQTCLYLCLVSMCDFSDYVVPSKKIKKVEGPQVKIVGRPLAIMRCTRILSFPILSFPI